MQAKDRRTWGEEGEREETRLKRSHVEKKGEESGNDIINDFSVVISVFTDLDSSLYFLLGHFSFVCTTEFTGERVSFSAFISMSLECSIMLDRFCGK